MARRLHSLLFALSLVAFVLTVGSCRDKLTEMLVVVSNDGLIVGEEIDAIDLTLRDPSGVVTHQQRVPLCVPGAPPTTARCLYFPFSALLVPGDEKPSQPVEVQIDALKGGTKVLANVAIFRFTKHKKLRLDVILYPECFGNLSCAQQKKACIQNGMCAELQPSELDPTTLPMQPDMGPSTDLAMSMPDLGSADLAMSMPDLAGADLAMSLPDLLPIVDFSPPPPDLTERDLIGCVPNCSLRMCGFDGCQGTCGVCAIGSQCNEGIGQCEPCGDTEKKCCAPPKALCKNASDFCSGGFCTPIPDMTVPPDDLSSTPDFSSDDFGLICGALGQICCPGPTCDPQLFCDNGTCQMAPPDFGMGCGSACDMTSPITSFDMGIGPPDFGGGFEFGKGLFELWGPF